MSCQSVKCFLCEARLSINALVPVSNCCDVGQVKVEVLPHIVKGLHTVILQSERQFTGFSRICVSSNAALLCMVNGPLNWMSRGRGSEGPEGFKSSIRNSQM